MENTEISKYIDQRLQAAINAKPGIKNLAASYVKARKKVGHVVKNAVNPHFKNEYATLDAVLDAFTEPFLEEGLALLQAPGDIHGDNAELHGLLMHESGETCSFRMQIPIGGKATAQSYGSAMTYARRYQAAAVAGIAQVDDDGEAASAPPPAAPKKDKPNKKDPTYAETVNAILQEIETMTDTNTEEVKAKVREVGDSKLIEAFQARRAVLAKGKK